MVELVFLRYWHGLHSWGLSPAQVLRAFAASPRTILPDYPFSRLTGTPTTLAGYGIADAYDKTTSDTRYSLSGHAHAGVYEPAFTAGTTAQYLRGDKSWQNLTTDVVQETATRKFYTDAYARASISVSGTNLTYDNLGGIIGFVASSEFHERVGKHRHTSAARSSD
jgi:hypothetical protein